MPTKKTEDEKNVLIGGPMPDETPAASESDVKAEAIPAPEKGATKIPKRASTGAKQGDPESHHDPLADLIGEWVDQRTGGDMAAAVFAELQARGLGTVEAVLASNVSDVQRAIQAAIRMDAHDFSRFIAGK